MEASGQKCTLVPFPWCTDFPYGILREYRWRIPVQIPFLPVLPLHAVWCSTRLRNSPLHRANHLIPCKSLYQIYHRHAVLSLRLQSALHFPYCAWQWGYHGHHPARWWNCLHEWFDAIFLQCPASLIDWVIYHLVYQVMQAFIADIPDIHRGTFTHRQGLLKPVYCLHHMKLVFRVFFHCFVLIKILKTNKFWSEKKYHKYTEIRGKNRFAALPKAAFFR